MHGNLSVAADRFGERHGVRAGDAGWSFRDLDELSNAFARHLSGQGVGAGDRVAVMMANRVEFITTVYAVSKLGAASVLLSPAWKATEVEHALRADRSGARGGRRGGAALLAGTLGAGGVTDLDDTATDPFAHSRDRPDSAGAGGTAEAILVFSSGTTGLPKAVRHTHASIGHATEHWRAVLGLGPDDRFQVATPPSHILGLLNLLTAVAAGATVRLHRRFDLDEVLHRIASERMTLEMAVAPDRPGAWPTIPASRSTTCRPCATSCGGRPRSPRASPAVVTDRTGVRWLPAYGASELPVIAANPVDRPESWRLDSAGLPPSGVELRIADLESGKVLGFGEIGEIQVLQPLRHGRLPPRRGHRRGVRRRLVPHRGRRVARAGGVGAPDRPLEGDDQGERLPGGTRRGGGRPLPSSRRARLRGLRRRRRTVRRGADGRGEGRPGPAAGRRRARATGRGVTGHVQAPSSRRHRRRDPAPALRQGVAPHAPRPMVAGAGRTAQDG